MKCGISRLMFYVQFEVDLKSGLQYKVQASWLRSWIHIHLFILIQPVGAIGALILMEFMGQASWCVLMGAREREAKIRIQRSRLLKERILEVTVCP